MGGKWTEPPGKLLHDEVVLHLRLSEIGYVVPQGLPLFILLPHVTTLKIRNFIPNRLGEQLLRVSEVGLHVQRPGDGTGPTREVHVPAVSP